jgi:hypothetical protein
MIFRPSVELHEKLKAELNREEKPDEEKFFNTLIKWRVIGIQYNFNGCELLRANGKFAKNIKVINLKQCKDISKYHQPRKPKEFFQLEDFVAFYWWLKQKHFSHLGDNTQ